jgi:hypothetical protein
MGWSDKTQKTATTSTQNTTQNNTATTTPNVPDWILRPTANLAGNIENIAGNWSNYAPSTNALQDQAWTGAANLKGPDYSASTNLINGVNPLTVQNVGSRDIQAGNIGTDDISSNNVSGESLLTGLENYYNPFKDQLTNPVLADYDVQAGQTRAAQAADAARNGGAFRGSRYGIQEGETEGNLARGRAATEGGLLKDMFTESTNLSGQDAARRQQASIANQSAALAAAQSNQNARLAAAQSNQSTGLSAAQSNQAKGLEADLANQAAGIDTGKFNTNTDLARAHELSGLQDSAGAADRANITMQAGAGQNQYDVANQIKQFPLEYQKQIEGLLQGLDPSLFTGQTISGSSTGTSTGTGTSNTTAGQGLGAWLGDALLAFAGSGKGGGGGSAQAAAALA